MLPNSSGVPYDKLQRKVFKLGVPPLPLLQELTGLVSFCTDHLDDFVEDTVKILLLITAFHLIQYLLRRVTAVNDGWLTHAAVAGICVIALFPTIDHVSDLAGDQTQGVQNWLRITMFGYRAKPVSYEKATPEVPWLVRVSDDYVEDTFKFACVGSHIWVSRLLSDALIPAMFAASERGVAMPILARTVDTIVSVGGPASQYTACNLYGDELGDVVQRWLHKLIKKEKKVQKKNLKRGKPVQPNGWWSKLW